MKTYSSKRNAIWMSAAFVVLAGMGTQALQAGYPQGYYDSLDGKCGVELMQAVKAVAIDHEEIPYNSGTWDAFRYTDVREINDASYWWDMYSNDLVSINNGHSGLNIEHSVPKSWWGGNKIAPYMDIVHLNPSNIEANSRKSNYPLAELGSVSWTNGVTSVGTPKSGQGGGSSYAFEPADEYKGDFARTYMYMFTIYDDISWMSKYNWMYDTSTDLMFKAWAQTLLLRWNADDPVGYKEEVRNDGVYEVQGNRNPFIDFPALADHIWGSKKDEPFRLSENGGQDPGQNPDPGQDPDPEQPVESRVYNWLGADDTDMGDWSIEDVYLEEGISWVWTWKAYNGTHYLNGSAYAANQAYEAEAYAWSPVVSMQNVRKATFKFEHAAKFQTTCRTLCTVAVRDVDTDEITLVDIPDWPSAGSWKFAESGNIDLADFSGQDIQVGFKYGSTGSGADTWEINNAELSLECAVSTTAPLTTDEDDSMLVEVWDNVILAPAGAQILDLGGRRYASGRALPKGLYIVTKPTFNKAVKVIVK